MVDVYVAAGSNIEPVRYLNRALEALEAEYAPLTVSPAYRNKAVGFAGADFLNLVVGFRSDQPLAKLRERLQAIEVWCDRPRDAPKWAARTMDLDILLYGALVGSVDGIVLPRPDLIKRAYMLKPMADIAPQVEHPVLHRTMQQLWLAFDAGGHELTEVTIPRYGPHRPPESDR